MLQKANNQQNGVQNKIQNINNNQSIPVNPLFIRESDQQNGKRQSSNLSFNQFRENGSAPLYQNSNNIDYQAQDKFKVLYNTNQLNQFSPQIPIKQYNSQQFQPNNMVQNQSSDYFQQNIQQPNQELQRPKNSVSLHNHGFGALVNQQQYNHNSEPIPQSTPYPNQNNSKIKIISSSKNNNPSLIEIDNKNANINNYQPNINTSPTVIDLDLFKRQYTIPKAQSEQFTTQVDQSLFERSSTQIQQTTPQPKYNSFNQNQQLQQTFIQTQTIFKTKEMNCLNCRMLIHSISIGLNCQHFYHQECYNEIINQQINAGKGIIFCICNKKISQKQLKQNLPERIINEIYKNQSRILQDIYIEKTRK